MTLTSRLKIRAFFAVHGHDALQSFKCQHRIRSNIGENRSSAGPIKEPECGAFAVAERSRRMHHLTR